VAGIGEVIARWNSTLDTTVLMLIAEINTLAEGLDLYDFLRPVTRIEVDALWTLDRREQARAVLQNSNDTLHDRLHRRRDEGWDEIRAAIERLRDARDVETDSLTGLPTRRHLGRWLPTVLSGNVPVCIAALDLDGFSQLNENFGREAGDAVLQEIAGLLERVCRRGDSVTRVGGDEFVMVLRDASPADARVVLERIRQQIAVRAWSCLPADVHISASIGATVGSGALNSDVLQSIAEDALHQAKASGGDQISFR
jgi:diguanylate cyclase (GGDEF)-like protein